MKIYNTLTGCVEPIAPIEPGLVKIYSCGPTVYRYIHIGNLRTFTMADWLRRALARAGCEVLHVKNITDVGHMRVELLDRGEDKLIAQARQEGKTAAEIAEFYTAAFRRDEARLNILPAHVFPRATDHIAEMIAIIAGLLETGTAYRAGGNVYFDVTRFPAYGKLSGNQMAQLIEGVRDAADPHKRNPEDFALWKAAEPGREMAWDSPWGRGFPGWHIECSAMSMKYLGPRFDIHTGGVDNIFPHHEDEIAQSEGYTGQLFVNTWVHAQHLLADGLKMAKSTGNAYTLTDIEGRGFEPLALRYLYAMTKYRARLNFTFTALRAAQTGLRRLRSAALRLATTTPSSVVRGQSQESRNVEFSTIDNGLLATDYWRDRFTTALEDDLNLPRAMAAVWDLLRGRGPVTSDELRLALLIEFDKVLGFGLAEEIRDWRLGIGDTKTNPQALISKLPEPIAALVREREALRRDKRYAQADILRQRIAAAGYTIGDTRDGSLVEQLAAEEEFPAITRSADAPNMSDTPDVYEFSINLLARDSRADLERCVRSIARHRAGRDVEIVIIDNGSTDDTIAYLQELARAGLRDVADDPIPLRVLFADHNLGFAAGRNATMRASRGRFIVLLDTSIELHGDIWAPLARALADETIGVAGPYGLVTDDLQEFYESAGPDVDAVEGYLMAFRRALLKEIGRFEEKFRFYRLLDVFESFMFKTSGYRVVAMPDLAGLLKQHPHREWYSLTEEERATRSKKNYDIFKHRWHHGQSLLAANFIYENRWPGHDHARHVGGTRAHTPEELPPPGQPHSHRHQHWPDHDHEHLHYHHLRDDAMTR
jgi:cysteinyl-tRNA synthetase